MNVRKKTTFIITVLCVFMLILAACPSAFVYIPKKNDRIPPNALDNNVERAQRPYWLVRPFGSDEWVSPGTEREVSFRHSVELIARSDTPGAVIHYAYGDSFAEISAFSSKSLTSSKINESDPFKLEGSFSTRAYKAAAEAPLFFPSNSNTLIVTIYPEQPVTPSFPVDKTPKDYEEPLDIEFKDQGFNIYYNIVIYPEDTNGNGELDPNELITPSDDDTVNLDDENVVISDVSDPDPADFPKIEQDDPLSGVITSSFEPSRGYRKYADNPIPDLMRGQTACVKAYAAHEKYRPSYRLEEDGSPTGILEGCFSVIAIVPAAPTNLRLSVGDSQLTATWTAPNDGGSDITAYHVQHRISADGDWSPTDTANIATINDAAATSHPITGLTNGTTYQVRVRAVNGAVTGAWSSSATVTIPTAPAAPINLNLTPIHIQITATWTAPNNGGSAITKYHVQHKQSSEEWPTDDTDTDTITPSDTSHIIMNLTNGASYDVRVRAVNIQGNGDWSDSATASPSDIAPNAPARPTIVAGDSQLTATWSAPDLNGGSPITSYDVQYKVSTATTWTQAPGNPISGTATSHTIPSLTNDGTSYDVQVRAVNTKGTGGWSASATRTLLPLAAQVPEGTAASVILSATIDEKIANAENPTVSLTTVEPGTLAVSGSGVITVTPATTPAGVTIPTVDAGTGVVAVAADTTAGTYLVYGSETGTGNVLFAEYFYVTVSPTTNAVLKTAVTTAIGDYTDANDSGIWGNTADLNYIITTAITNMSEMFKYASAFNGDISRWDVSKVTNMEEMFFGATVFNGNISGWNVSSVTDMSGMFAEAIAFDGDISGWNVSSVTNMSSMFYKTAFNGDISRWNVSMVTNMYGMFRNASEFNGDISGWDVSKVTKMSFMFNEAPSFNRDIAGWDVSSVTHMGSMFYDASAFNQNLEEWMDHWSSDNDADPDTVGINTIGKYTGSITNMFTGSGVTGNLLPSWY
ncbi:MAG: BspA family leucine-rich repeat surface protein [Salinispira sp.]